MKNKPLISVEQYQEYKKIVSKRKAKIKKICTPMGAIVALSFIASIILISAFTIPWGFVAFGVLAVSLLITYIVLWQPVVNKANEIDRYEEELEKERERISRDLELQQIADMQNKIQYHIKQTAIIQTHTGKDNTDTMNRGVVGGLLFGATGAIVGTATAQEKSYTTFLIIFDDDTRTTQKVENNSPMYNHFIQYLQI